MEDFKLVFYIAVAIAWVIYKNYQKVQQNRPKTVQPPVAGTETLSEKKTLADLILEKQQQFKKDFDEKKSEIKKEFKATEKLKQSKPVLKDELKRKMPVISPLLSTDMKPAYSNSITDERKQPDTNTVIHKNFEEDLFDLKKFDIRTAIIYSEILKRPYV